ncbi:MAG TPA: 23S rRNA (guanosine(2251)-2'-O)-methyltransferase RlmB [Baekduia sp.]|uniref:23S rRNA (guanosine(2251)-2'-O)-methyltransferase RlmB n=1 Tax=Baekduia sp. TaxID=2600305 RepID=UPI002B670EC4|nr:23S rRNA (guanosine(2251)-2'-O)-methyltransferase RlmB [Baekduia sp.]HMJ34026.1 23S rRNA (guanosine(2251)-2'-O)-methyltransferase RlmB [Baekduia sp.]
MSPRGGSGGSGGSGPDDEGRPGPRGKRGGKSPGRKPEGAKPAGRQTGKRRTARDGAGAAADRDAAGPPRAGRPKPARSRGVVRGRDATPPREVTRPDAAHFLYGRNPIREALRSGRRPVNRVWATTSAAREPWLEGVLVEAADGDWLTARAGTDAHQGLCADVGEYPYVDEASLLTGPNPLIVVLDEVQDPQNLGAIARTAEAVGATGLVLPRHRSAEVTPAAAKASAGAVEHLPIAQVRNVADFLADAKGAGCWIYGAAAKGAPYRQPDYEGGVVLVMGAEGKGLRPRVRAMCDEIVALPLRGRIESLNVSAAAAALLYGVLDAR